MKDWRKEYEKRTISADEAAQFIKSGQHVVFTAGREAFAIGLALAARKDELKGVKIFVPTPGYDFGWYDEGWQDSFEITVNMPTAICQEAIDARRVDINFGTLVPFYMEKSLMEPDVLLTEISPPDEHGFCSFGQSLWNKKRHVKAAKLVIAEVNSNLIRTGGDNFIHVSEIDYFVEHLSTGAVPGTGSLAGRALKELEPYVNDIAGYVSSLIHDRDTCQIGVGRTTEPLVQAGLFNGKHDLGWHSEATPKGVIGLIRDGVINGKYKTLDKNLAVVTSLGGGSREEMEWANNNPMFSLVDIEYLEDIRVIAAQDNFMAINQGLCVDLTGQVAAENLGERIFSVAGGQIPFAVGANISKGGRNITVIPSTAQGGKISRIVPSLPQGTAVTTSRNLGQYVVTEYGIAHIWGKSIRQRVEALIAIAHPDFRAELRKEARRMYWS